MKTKWTIINYKCPKCSRHTKVKSEKRDDGHWYNIAEKCPNGCFYIDFKKDNIG